MASSGPRVGRKSGRGGPGWSGGKGKKRREEWKGHRGQVWVWEEEEKEEEEKEKEEEEEEVEEEVEEEEEKGKGGGEGGRRGKGRWGGEGQGVFQCNQKHSHSLHQPGCRLPAVDALWWCLGSTPNRC